MKLIVRSMIAVLFLTALALPSLAQRPDVAVRISSPSGSCFRVMVNNLRTTPTKINVAYITIFDQDTCKKTCEFKVSIRKELGPCKTLDFKICCEGRLPSKYIAYVLVYHSAGNNEQWYYRP
jgi:hypothetical protein